MGIMGGVELGLAEESLRGTVVERGAHVSLSPCTQCQKMKDSDGRYACLVLPLIAYSDQVESTSKLSSSF